jgi:hypothetical protein
MLGVVLVAVLGHLPATVGFFFRDDWTHLAAAADGSWPSLAQPGVFFDAAFAPLLYRVFHLGAVAYKTLTLLLWGLCTLLTMRVAFRLGQSEIASLTAGLVVAATPLVIVPIFWWSASSQVVAVTLALAAADRWLAGTRVDLALALLLAVLAAFTAESALGIGIALAAGWVLGLRPVNGRGARVRAGVWSGLAVILAAALVTAWWWLAPGSGDDAPGVNPPRAILLRLAAAAGWLVTPGRFAPAEDPLLACLGTLVWAAWFDLAARRWSCGDRSVAFALVWASLVVLPTVAPPRDLAPFHLLMAVPALGWAVGGFVEPWLEPALRRRAWPAFAGVVLVSVLLATFGATFGSTTSRLYARDRLGRLRNPDLRLSRMASAAQAAVDSLALDATKCVCVYTPREPKLPADAPAERIERILRKVSPVHVALQGRTGLATMLPDSVATSWRLDLDDVDGQCQVLLDRGTETLRPIGTVDNTRLTLAMQAVNLGRHEEAMDLLVLVIGEGGREIKYEYDPQAIGISSSRLELMAPSFVRYLDDENSASAAVVRDFFLQMFAFMMGILESPQRDDSVVPPPVTEESP